MITENMKLSSVNDARQWASDMRLNTEMEIQNVARWIWNNKPALGCTYNEHPIESLEIDDFWTIAMMKD